MVKTLVAQFETNDRKIFWGLSTLIVLVVVSYMYFLYVSVHSVVERKTAEAEVGKISAKISALESRYVALDSRITLALAHESGFVDVLKPKYVSRIEGHDTFTLREAGERR